MNRIAKGFAALAATASLLAFAPAGAQAATTWPDPSFETFYHYDRTGADQVTKTHLNLAIYGIKDTKALKVKVFDCSGNVARQKTVKVNHRKSVIVDWKGLKGAQSVKVVARTPDPDKSSKGGSYSTVWNAELQNQSICS